VAGELFGCCQASVSRLLTVLCPLLGVVNAELLARVKGAGIRRAAAGGWVRRLDRGTFPCRGDMFSDKHHECGFNVQVVANTAGWLALEIYPVPG
jgi:hypothetical protein